MPRKNNMLRSRIAEFLMTKEGWEACTDEIYEHFISIGGRYVPNKKQLAAVLAVTPEFVKLGHRRKDKNDFSGPYDICIWQYQKQPLCPDEIT